MSGRADISSTLKRLTEISRIRELEREAQEEKERQEKEKMEQMIMASLQVPAGVSHDEHIEGREVVEEKEDAAASEGDRVEIYFKDIVKNANSKGDTIDLTKYQTFMKEYAGEGNQRKRQLPSTSTEELDDRFRLGDEGASTRKKVYTVMRKPANRNTKEKEAEESGEQEEFVPSLSGSKFVALNE